VEDRRAALRKKGEPEGSTAAQTDDRRSDNTETVQAAKQRDIDRASELYDIDNASPGSVLLESLPAVFKSNYPDVISKGHLKSPVSGRIAAKCKIFTSQEQPEDLSDAGLLPFWASDSQAEPKAYSSWTLNPSVNRLLPGLSLKFVARPGSALKSEGERHYTFEGVLKVSSR